MSTSPTTRLSKPSEGERVPPETFGYLRARAKRKAYDLVMKEFEKSRISKAELARRLGKGADRVSRMLGGPGNWTLATMSDLLFAITAGVPSFNVDYPLDKPARNYGAREQYTFKVSQGSSASVGALTNTGGKFESRQVP